MKNVTFFILLIIMSTLVYSYDYEKELTTAQLPFNNFTMFNFDVIDLNSDLIFYSVNSSNNLLIAKTSDNITSLSNIDVRVNISIPFNYDVGEKIEYLIVKNNLSNVVFNKSFRIKINKSEEVRFIQLDINSFEYSDICNFRLPLVLNKSIVVSGRAGDNLTGKDVTNNFVHINNVTTIVDVDNVSEVMLFINLSQSVNTSNIKEFYEFDVGGIKSNVSFNFKIIECVASLADFAKALDECSRLYNHESTEYALCYAKAQSIYYQKIVDELNKANRSTVVNNTVEVIVPRDVIHNVLEVDDYATLLDAAGLAKNMRNLSDMLTASQQELLRLQLQYPELLEQSVKEYQLRIEQERKERVGKVSIWYLIIFVIVLVIFCIGYVIYSYDKNSMWPWGW